MRKKRLISLVFMTLLLAASGFAQITVLGTNTYPADVNNVQAAVMTSNTTVYLSGTFNFGPDGSVLINVPNVTLEAALTGATIVGGTNPITTDDGTPPSGAKNLTIRNIAFEGWSGVAIYHAGVQDETNFALIEGNTFDNTAHPEWFGAGGIDYSMDGGSAEFKDNTFIDNSLQAIYVHNLALHSDDHILISGNTISNSTLDAIVVEIWDPAAGEMDNGPVIIRNNEININYLYCWGIASGGYSFFGTSNAVIEGNAFTGYGDAGIAMWPFGRNRKIINNDFSGLQTMEPNIFDCGREDLIAGNVMGTTDPEAAAAIGVPFHATAIIISSTNPAAWGWPLPDSLPVTDIVLMNNDFRHTGLPGWAYDAATDTLSLGCVLLASHADLGYAPPWPGAEVTNNLVKETGMFPQGTGGPKQQILEFPVYAHGNRIIGHAANEYAQLEASNPGIGQKIKESGANSVLLMKNRRASVREAQ